MLPYYHPDNTLTPAMLAGMLPHMREELASGIMDSQKNGVSCDPEVMRAAESLRKGYRSALELACDLDLTDQYGVLKGE